MGINQGLDPDSFKAKFEIRKQPNALEDLEHCIIKKLHLKKRLSRVLIKKRKHQVPIAKASVPPRPAKG